ncbi:hypothetical protein R69919_02725 [Paraburkholderia gardini]|nr:hypothetical protein R69919_02725 [Paraburkholderia gardini]
MGLTSLPEHRAVLLRLCRPSPYPEWLLLQLTNGMFGAFWHQGFDGDLCITVAEGRYRDGCAYRSRAEQRVLEWMNRNRLG